MEKRKINTNLINGMDLRDYDVDQQQTKEIINLVKDKHGWKTRDPLHEVLSNIQSYQNVNAMIQTDDNKIVLHVDKSILFYDITGDEIGQLNEKIDFTYDFKLYKTNYPLIFFQIDTTNHKSYVLEFTDRLMVFINDTTSPLTLSTFTLLHEYDINSQDLTWTALGRNDTYATNGNTYINGVDTYNINYDTKNQGQQAEWNQAVLLIEYDNNTNSQRYIMVAGYGADTYIYVFDWNDLTPSFYTKKLKYTGKNVFLLDGTGAINRNAIFMDIYISSTLISTPSAWLSFGTDLNDITVVCSIKVSDDYYVGTLGSGAWKLTGGTGAWSQFGTGLDSYSINSLINVGSDYYAGTDSGGVWKLTGGTGAWARFGTGIDSYTIKTLLNSGSDYYAGTGGSGNGILKLTGGIGAWGNTADGSSGPVPFSNSIIKVGSDYYSIAYYFGFPSDIYWGLLKWTSGAGTWNLIGNNFGFIEPLCLINVGSDYYVGLTGQGVKKLTGGTGTWNQFGSGIDSKTVYSLINVGSDYYAGAASSGIYKLTNGTGTWVQLGTGVETKNVYSILNSGTTGFYIGATLTGLLYLSYTTTIDYSSSDLELYIPNGRYVSKINTQSSITTCVYTASAIDCGTGADVKQCKIIDAVFDSSNRLTYLYSQVNTQSQMYLLYKTGSRESATANTFVLRSGTITNSFNYINYNGSHIVENRKYDDNFSTTSANCKGYAVLSLYSDNTVTRVDVIDVKIGNVTATMNRTSVGEAIVNTSPYYLGNTIYQIGGTRKATIIDNNQTHKFYLSIDKRIYSFPVTGQQMTSDDITKIKDIYGVEMSGYCDPTGSIINGVVSNPFGYVTTEINNSKPLPLKPFYTADTSDALTNVSVITVTGDTAGVFSNVNTFSTSNVQVNIRGATASNTDNFRLYWKVNSAGDSRSIYFFNSSARSSATQVMSTTKSIAAGVSAIAILSINNSSGFQTGNCNVVIHIGASYSDTVSNNQILTVGQDNSEYFNMYNMVLTDGRNFRTPITVGNGAIHKMHSDDRSNVFKYWIFYLLYSGLYDRTIPYISLAKGTQNIVNNNYSLLYWKNDTSTTGDAIDNLPRNFSNIESNFLPTSTSVLQTYISNDKLLYKYNDTYRDRFNATAFWQQTKNIVFEIQDLKISAAELLMALDYNNKAVIWSTGFKYMNLLNVAQLLSKPVSIEEINRNTSIIACENHFYYLTGVDETNMNTTLILSNTGLEKDNYNALVTNGVQTFYYNKRGIWMIDNSSLYSTTSSNNPSQLINLSPPIQDYLFNRVSGNWIGIDHADNLLYIPIDYSSMIPLKSNLLIGDYGIALDTTIEYNKPFAIFDYNNNTFRLNAFYDSLTSSSITYNDFIGQLNNYIVVRNGTKLIIPEYKNSVGTENPLCRIASKRISFGSFHNLKKLDSLYVTLINTINYELQSFGCDHLKLYFILDNKYILSYKYGDYNSLSNAYSDVNAVYYSNIATSSNDGFQLGKFPIGLDFHEVEIVIEFGRFTGTGSTTSAIAQVSISDFTLDVINKGSEINGLR